MRISGSFLFFMLMLATGMMIGCGHNGGSGGDEDIADDDILDDDAVDDDMGDDADDDIDDDADDDVDDDADDDDDTVDTEPPVITNTDRLPDSTSYGPFAVHTDVDDNVDVTSVSLFYRVNGGDFTEVAMSADKTATTYSAFIPPEDLSDYIEYYVRAADAADNVATDPADAPTTLYAFWIIGPSVVQYDDGTAEGCTSAYGVGSFSCLRITPPAYPAYIKTFTYSFNSFDPGAVVEPMILYDSDDGATPPDISGAISVMDPFTPSGSDLFYDIDLTGVPGLANPLTSGDFYCCFKNHTDAQVYWNWDVDSPETDRSWNYRTDISSWENLYPGYAGGYMFRATVLTP